ncbi:hypothetical protein D9M71_797740 [compost metagenome]
MWVVEDTFRDHYDAACAYIKAQKKYTIRDFPRDLNKAFDDTAKAYADALRARDAALEVCDAYREESQK